MKRMPTPLHRRLWVIVAAALLPTAALSAIAVMLLHRQQEGEVARATIETMRAMVSAVDSELGNTVAVAETLASSNALANGDLSAFRGEAVRVAQAKPLWLSVALFDRQGRQLLNTRQTLDAPLPADPGHRTLKRVVQTGKSAVGNLVSVSDDTRGFAVWVPIKDDARAVTHVLTAFVSPTSMRAVIMRQRVPPDGVVSIFDPMGNHVARSRGHERFLGRPGSEALRKLMGNANEGWGRSMTLEGQPIYAAFSRSAMSGWSVAVGVPAADIDAAVGQSLVTLALGLVLSIALGVLASLAMARSVIVPITALRGAAHAVGRGEVPEMGPVQIAEIDDVARALVGAARARRQAEETREELLQRERAARAAAEQANRSKDEFLAMLGHELRNPLSAIGNAIHVIEAMRTRGGSAQSSVSAERVIKRQVNHLARLVDDLLDVARVVSGKVSLESHVVDAAEIVQHSVATLTASGRFDQHELNVQAESVWVRGDPTRLEQVVNNLLVNAIKYTPKGGRIDVSVAKRGHEVILQVRDNGVGIGRHLLPRVFELFTQAERGLARTQGGLGVGLTLVKQLVELHGGTVTAASDGEGKGSVFSVELPAVEAPQSVPSVDARRDEASCDILIVEDNPDSRDMLNALLHAQGHRVIVATDGPEGVARALAEKPQLALVDLGLPGFDGFEVARRIRAALNEHDLILVALSGYGTEKDRQRSQGAGFDLHLVKPVSLDVLNEVIGRVRQPLRNEPVRNP